MIGHGRPQAWFASYGSAPWRRLLCALVLLACAPEPAAAQDQSPNVRLRVQWGGPVSRIWQGEISASGAVLSDPVPLGIEADEPGSMWIDAERLIVQPRSARAFDGVDLTLAGAADAELTVRLQAEPQGDAPPHVVKLTELLERPFSTTLDEQGTQLTVRRAPGDALRVVMQRDSLVFAPGETWKIAIEPTLLPTSLGNRIRLALSLLPAGEETVLWSQEEDRELIGPGRSSEPLTAEIPLPAEEGVYELRVEARGVGLRSRLTLRAPLVERKVQLAVIDNRPPHRADAREPWRTILEIDPATTRWWERFGTLPRLPGLRPGPLGSGEIRRRSHPLGTFVELGPRATEPHASWEAYPLPIDRPGLPHLVEIDYPSDVSQTMGLSIVEPDAAGSISPIGVDSGLYVPADAALQPARVQTHRIVVWPRTRTPFLVVTNRRETGHAVFGKIRVLAGPQFLAPLDLPAAGAESRLLALQLDRPLANKCFSAGESLDRASGRSLDDWQTFYDGSRRLVDYLRHQGRNGLFLGVLADGSTIYPSRTLEPTPRYDTGILFEDARDPVRKDALELLLRLFDREGLALVPQLHLTAPVPALETLRRGADPGQSGIEPVGADGRTWAETHPPRRGQGAYYNLLDPRVQQALLAVVDELLERASAHPSMAGLAIDLSGDGYAILPGANWGLDDQTISRFQQATGIAISAQGPGRFAARAKALETHRAAWLAWRADQVAGFYASLAARLRQARPDARLYLLGARIFDGAELRRALKPDLARRVAPDELMLDVGLDASGLAAIEGLVLVRSERLAPDDQLASRGVDQELALSPQLDRACRATALDAQLFFHEPQRLRLPEFDLRSPFRGSTTWLVSQLQPAGAHNRQRFVRALARSDAQVLVDGGWLAPLGQEDALAPIVEVFRRLPAARFEAVTGVPQPVLVRTWSDARRTIAYLVNDSPWPVAAELNVQAPVGTTVASLDPSRALEPLPPRGQPRPWRVALEPYDLVGVEFSQPQVDVSAGHVELPESAPAELAGRIKALGDRAAAIGALGPWDALVGGGFEAPGNGSQPAAGWQTDTADAALDPVDPHEGRVALRLTSEAAGVRLSSDPLPAPQTGRLSMAVWLRIADAARQPTLRLAVAGKLDGREYYRYAPLGAGSQTPLGTQWAQFLFQIPDLPLTGLTDLKVQIELLGAGQVWIDQVELYDLWLSERERVELSKIITTAHLRLEAAQYSDCLRLVDGYWPRLLEARIPAPAAEVTRQPPTTQPPREALRQPPPAPGWKDRLNGLLPRALRF